MITQDNKLPNVRGAKADHFKPIFLAGSARYPASLAENLRHWEEAADAAIAASDWSDYAFCMSVLEGYEARARRNQLILLVCCLLGLGLLAALLFYLMFSGAFHQNYQLVGK